MKLFERALLHLLKYRIIITFEKTLVKKREEKQKKKNRNKLLALFLNSRIRLKFSISREEIVN